MSNRDQRALRAILRQDFHSFVRKAFQVVSPGQHFHDNWHLHAIAWKLQQIASGEITRLVITVPPRSLKSICASVAFPAWVLGRDPTSRLICVSYAESLAKSLSMDCRAVMQTGWYRELFPRSRLSEVKNTALEFATSQAGYRMATSVGGTLTGRGGNIIIIDDPLKPDEAMSETQRNKVNEWYDRTLYSRLDDKRTGAIVIVMQRLHLEDLVGHVLIQEGWDHMSFPAIAPAEQRVEIGPNTYHLRQPGDLLHPEREPQSVLGALKQQLGSYNFSAQYLQEPLPMDGNVVSWSWFRVYARMPARQPGDLVVQSWDPASKVGPTNDYSVGTTWLVQGADYYLLDVVRKRLRFPELKARIIAEARRCSADAILIEDHGNGTGLIQELHSNGPSDIPKPIPCRPRMDKVVRMQAQSVKIEAGQVHLPARARWLDDFRTEFLQFPVGRYDDQVDSVSQFLCWAQVRHPPKLTCNVYALGWDPS